MASALISMLLRAGLLSDGQAAAAREHARVRKIRDVDALLELGLVDEDTVVTFTHSRLMIPRVQPNVLARVPARIRAWIPAALAAEFAVMPVSIDDAGNLTLAMVDPTEQAAVEAVAVQTRAYVVRAVAPATALARAIEDTYGIVARAGIESLDPGATQPGMRLSPPAQRPATTPPVRVLAQHPDLDDRSPAVRLADAHARRTGLGPYAAAEGVMGRPAASAVPAPATARPTPTGDPYGEPADPYAAARRSAAASPAASPETTYPQSPAWSQAPTGARQGSVSATVRGFGALGGAAPTPELGASGRARPIAPGALDNTVAADAAPARPPGSIDPRRPSQAFSHLGDLPRGPRPPSAVATFAGVSSPESSGVMPYAAPTASTTVAASHPAGPSSSAAPLGVATPAARPSSRTPQRPWNPTSLTGPRAEPTPLSPEAFGLVLPRLVAAEDRDAVVRILLDFLGAGFQRVLLFVHSRGELRGHDCRGADLLVEAVRTVRIPSTGPSVFSRAIEARQPYFGRLRGDDPIDQAFSRALGGVAGNVLVLPINLADKVPLLVFAHGTQHPVDPVSVRELCDGVADVLARLIARSRAR